MTATQLPLPIDGLDRKHTPSMLRGVQVVRQCAWCGCVVIVPGSDTLPTPDFKGTPCPACGQTRHGWWREYVGPGHELCGFRLEGASAP